MRKTIYNVYSGIAIAIDALALMICLAGLVGNVLKRHDAGHAVMTGVMALIPAMFMAINIVEIVRAGKGHMKIIGCSILMKSTVFCVLFATFYLTPPVYILPAFFCFMGLALFIGIITVAYCRNENNRVPEETRYMVKNPFLTYDARRSPVTERMATIYLLQWLADRGFMTDTFYTKFDGKFMDSEEVLDSLFDRRMRSEYIKPEILPFLNEYCIPRMGYDNENPNYLRDLSPYADSRMAEEVIDRRYDWFTARKESIAR